MARPEPVSEERPPCEEAVWFTQTMLIGPRHDMDEIAAAIRKIGHHADAIARA